MYLKGQDNMEWSFGSSQSNLKVVITKIWFKFSWSHLS